MNPAILENFGLSEALRWLIRQMTSDNGFHVVADIGEIDGILPNDSELVVFRIFQEAISNIVRHAGASRIVLTGKAIENELTFELQDDGKGFDLANAMYSDVKNQGLGLASIYERSRHIEGYLNINSNAGFGTSITLRIPVNNGCRSPNERLNP